MKVVVNRCWGGFGLSYEAVMELGKRKGLTLYAWGNARTGDHIDFDKYVPYDGTGEAPFVVHYTTAPITGERGEMNDSYYSPHPDRNDPDLVAIVEEFGARANGQHAKLEIVDIPDDVEWEIDEYDGMEHVAEKHRTW
jgi:hypothetical protein